MSLRTSWAVLAVVSLLGAGASQAQPAQPAGEPTSASATPASAVTSAPAAGAPAAPAAAGDAPGYTVRLRALERSVSELKEQVFRTKAKLQLLKETVLGGVIGASRGVIRHHNEMGGSFRLVKAVYALDGVQIFAKADDSGRLSDMKDFDIYNGAIQPGSHTITVQLVYQGHGFGVFSYLKGYKFERPLQPHVRGRRRQGDRGHGRRLREGWGNHQHGRQAGDRLQGQRHGARGDRGGRARQEIALATGASLAGAGSRDTEDTARVLRGGCDVTSYD